MARVWTIGFEGRTPESVVDLLQRSGVHRVVDVREAPLSRKKGFSKEGLKEILEAQGIDYTHKPELGLSAGLREAQHHDWAKVAAQYRQQLDHEGPALAWLLQAAEEGPTCLLCFEEDHEACHRSLLAARMEQAGMQVLHL